jgi:hypothetical protein
MTMPAGLLRWGQAGSYDAIDDRSVITALAGGRVGLVQPPTMAAGAGLVVNIGPWLALVDAGDGTTAVIGDRDSQAIPVAAGTASARTETLWADINPEAATWGPLQVLGAPALVGRAGVALGTITTPANANAASALTLTQATPLPPVGAIIRISPQDEDRANTVAWTLSTYLQAQIEANSTYAFTLGCSYRGGGGASVGHIRANFTRPAGATGRYGLLYRGTGMTNLLYQDWEMGTEGNVRWGTDGVSNYYPIWIHGFVKTAAAAGTFGLAWGQGTSAGTICRILAGATLTLTKQ